jgi:hypothetical protein
MNVGTLFVKFGADLSEFARGSDEVGRRLDGIGKRVGAVGVSMTKWVTGPIVAATAGIVALAKSTGDYADRIGDLTDITGMSARSIQEWQYVAKIAGVETEAVTTAVEGLVRRLPQLEVEGGRSTEQLAKLGLTFADLQGMAPDKMMETLIRRLSAMEDPLERNAIGSALFGGAWKDIAPILGMGAGAIDEARKRASELGLVMSDESLDAADKFRRAMVELTSTLGGAARNIGAELAPIITDILLPAIRDRVVPAIAGFVAKIRELIRWFADLSPTWRNVIGLAVGCAVAIGPVLVVVGKLIPLFGVLAGVIKGVGVALAFLAANPIGMVIVAVGALIAVGVALWRNWETIKEKLLDIWQAIVGGIKGFVNIFARALNVMIGGLNKINFTVPSWVPLVGGKGWGFNLAEIPLLHGGGEFRAPRPGGEGLALLKDRECVLPAGAAATRDGGTARIEALLGAILATLKVEHAPDPEGLFRGAHIHVRDDQDIRRLAQEFYALYSSRARAAGVIA